MVVREEFIYLIEICHEPLFHVFQIGRGETLGECIKAGVVQFLIKTADAVSNERQIVHNFKNCKNLTCFDNYVVGDRDVIFRIASLNHRPLLKKM